MMTFGGGLTQGNLDKNETHVVFRYLGYVAIALLMWVFIRTTWISDDAMITLRSVMNFTNGYGPVFNIGERVQSYTHTSWFFLVSLFTLLIDDPFYAIVAVSLITNLAFLILVFTNSRKEAFLVFCIVIACSRAFIDFANSGLENPLSFLLIAGLIYAHVNHTQENRPVVLIYFILGLLILTRPDLGVFLVAYGAFFLRKGTLKRALLGLTPLILWEVFSLFYYGTIIPNSALSKISTGIPKSELFAQGIVYYLHNIRLDPVTFVTILAFLAGAVRQKRLLWLALAVILYLLYILYVGGDFMAGRFLTVPFVASAIGLLVLTQDAQPRWPLVFVIAFLAVPALSAKNLYANFIAGQSYNNRVIYDNGLADERGFYFANYSLLTRNWPDMPEWEHDPSRHPEFVPLVCGLLGNLSLRWGPNVHPIDVCGLSDPLLARLPMRYVGEGDWRIGHFDRQVPTSYHAVISGIAPEIDEPLAAALYADVKRVTQSPLWSSERFAAIWRLNTKDYGVSHLYAHSEIPATNYPIIRSYDSLSHTDANGLPWNHEGVVFFDQQLMITIGAEVETVSFSLDSHDTYDIAVFDDQNQIVLRQDIRHSYSSDLVTATLSLPERTLVDRVEITALYGDGTISLGHMKVQ